MLVYSYYIAKQSCEKECYVLIMNNRPGLLVQHILKPKFPNTLIIPGTKQCFNEAPCLCELGRVNGPLFVFKLGNAL